jgi:hypothetical protein
MGDQSPAPDASTDSSGLLRPHFYPRQLLKSSDLNLDQSYFIERLRRHNRLFHAGFKRGAELVTTSTNSLALNPGYLIGPYGDEIFITEKINLDLEQRNSEGTLYTTASGTGSDASQSQPLTVGTPYYLCICYLECQVSPVMTLSGECGCPQEKCEYACLCDGFEIRLLADPPPVIDLDPLFPEPGHAWIQLATVTVDAQGNITLT